MDQFVLTLDARKLADVTLPIATGWLLGFCMEARGKQDLWARQKPETLSVLRERAIIQSSESSNRIEGITVAADRLRPLVIGRVRPRDRSEEELAGYRSALDWIFTRKRPVPLTPDVVLRLHALTQRGSPITGVSSDPGRWKTRDNQIIEILSSGERTVRFTPVSAKRTPGAMQKLCDAYHRVCDEQRVPPLLCIATFVFDFLCIHPFRDGNGRVSRLLTTLLLESHGFQVARYISLERVIEESKVEYYRVLQECSEGWHAGKSDIVPWWNYFLGMIRSAYREFEHAVESASARPPKTDLVRKTILDQLEEFTLADLAAQLPSISTQLIKKVLTEMKLAKQVRLSGHGRGARWRRTEVTSSSRRSS